MGFGHHRGDHCEDLDGPRVAPQLGGRRPQRTNRATHDLCCRAGNESRLSVGRREPDSPRRGAGLKQHRSALRRRLAQKGPGNREVAAPVRDVMHFGRVGEHSPGRVAHHRIGFPRRFPQLVADLEIFVGDLVTLVVRDLRVQAEIACGTVQIRRDDVPRHPAAGEVIQCREPARQSVGLLVGQRQGDPEPEGLGHRGHRRHGHRRVVDRDLRGIGHCRIARAAVHVIDAEHVGQKQRVEASGFEYAGQFGPVPEFAIAVALIVGVAPQPCRLMPDAGHVKGVEVDPAHALASVST